MSVVRLRTAKLIVRHDGSRACCGWTTWQVLQLTAAAIVPDEDIELAVRTKTDDATVMVATQGLSRIGLEGPQADDV